MYIYIYNVKYRNRILNTITYIRVKADTTLYYNKKILTSSGALTPSSMIHCNDMKTPFEKEHCYYIIEKGKIELTIDNNKYHIERDGSISTKAILKNTQEECKLTTLKRVYLYKMPIEKYISIFNEFVDNLIDEKVTMFKRNYIFALSETHHLIQLANVCPKLTHDNKALLIEESKIPEALYIIVSGRVSCYKSGKLLHILTENDVLGELGLFTQYESNFDYYAEPGCVVIEIMYHVINDVFCENDNPIQKMVHNVFRNAIKTSRVLSKYFSDDNYLNIFETFQLKYYFNDTLSNKKIRKVYMHLAGILTETKNEQNKDITPKGQFVEEEITCDNNQINKYTLFSEECLVLESSWLELTKNMFPYSDKGISFYDKMFFLKRLKSLKDINEFKLFSLAESLRYKTYQENTLIIHLNKTPNELFIIKTGHVKIEINDVVVKVLGPGNYFGNMITPFHKVHSNDVSYIAKTNVEIYSLKKEDYDEVMDWEILKPFNKILIKDNKININELYYIKELGQGSYGKVYLVHNKEKYFAVKTADIQAMDQSEDKGRCYLNEKSIMSSIEHPFIVQLINTFKTSEYIFFIIEYIKGITLRDYMNEYQDHLRDIPETTFIAALLCSIITYLQKKRIIHRDLKPDNLMIDSVTGYVKAIDFGAAKNLSGKDSTYTVIGTPQYMAPEALGGSGSCCSTDIWSVGVILYECFYGTLPYGNGSSNPVELYGEIKGNEIVFPSDPRNNKVNVFLKKLLTKDPEKRMNEFSLWKNYTLFSDLDFELLNKKLFISPLLDKLKMSSNVKHEMGCELSNYIASQNEQKEDLKNISCPFHLFMKNTLFSLNDLEFSTLIRTRTDYSYNDF